MDSKQKWKENNPDYQKQYYELNKVWINQKKKECREAKKEEYAEVARERYRLKRDEILARSRQQRKENPKSVLLNLARSRAKKHNLPFNITSDDFDIPEICPLLGIPIKSQSVKQTDNSPSLDKIHPSLGYVKGNVWIVSARANRLKSDSTADELLLLANQLRKKYK